MTNKNSAKDQVEQRWNQFQSDHPVAEFPGVRRILHEIAEMMSAIVGIENAGRVITEMYRAAGIDLTAHARQDHVDDEDTYWMNADEYLPLEEIQKFTLHRTRVNLEAYAFYGLKPEPDSFAGDIDSLEEGLPRDWMGDEFAKALQAANTRFWIDFATRDAGAGVGSQRTTPFQITAEGLAALAGVSVKTVKNELAPSKQGGIRKDKDAAIRVDDAVRWLATRKNFRPTLWESAPGVSEAPQLSSVHELSDAVFVPVAKDGTIFSPDLKQKDGCYHIGPYGGERAVESYAEALGALARMEPPMWRRPDASGRWRMTVGTEWKRTTRGELRLTKED